MLGGEIGYLENEYRTRYLRFGSGEKSPLVFLHGIGGHAEAYIKNIRPIAATLGDREVYAIDFIGHGYSSAPEDIRYSIPDFVGHVEDVLDVIGTQQAHIHGESLGGWVAARLGLDRPDRVVSVGLNTTGGIRESLSATSTHTATEAERAEIRDLFDRTTTMLERGCPRELVKHRIEWLFFDEPPEELIDIRTEIYQRQPIQNVMAQIYRTILLNFEDEWYLQPTELRSLDRPTLVIHTEHNPGTHPETIEYLHDLLPKSSYHLYDRSAHWPQFEEAERFNSDTVEFIKGV